MRLTWGTLGIVCLSGVAALPTVKERCNDRSYSAIVTFGDSFSDNGNGAWVISNKTWPADPHYAEGRFSNGPVWIEYVANNLSLPLVDYAVGGATSSNAIVQGFTGPGSTIPVPSIDEQVDNFLANPPSNISLSSALFVLFGGANDAFFNPNVTASQSFQALMASKGALSSAYPTAMFLFLAYPDLARTPVAFYLDRRSKRELSTYSRELAALYRDALLPGTGESFLFVDSGPLFADYDYYGSPSAYGFAPLGAYGSCLTGVYRETESVTVCDDADQMVFWDEYHPTTHAHSWLAKLVLQTLAR